MITPSILPGFEELLPQEQLVFNQMMKIIQTTFEANGLQPMDTPVIEKAEVLLAKSEGETEKQVYRFTKGKHDLALRFDLTVPFARYVSQHFNELVFPFKRYQIGKVYRGEKSQKGRYREFYQCDIDVVGKDSLSITNDAWIISVMAEILSSLQLPAYKLKISNRKILTGLLQAQKITEIDAVMVLIDKYTKMDKETFYEELIEITGSENASILMNVINSANQPESILQQLCSMYPDNTNVSQGIKELLNVIELLEQFGIPKQNYQIDLSIIRGLDYYTGTIFETELTGYEQYGSICSGGRYDQLTDLYSNNRIQGMGASIGLTRLFYILRETHLIDDIMQQASCLDFLILPIGNTLRDCIALSKKIRLLGYRCSIYLESDSLKKSLTYAHKIQVPYIILLGEDEVKEHKLTIKDMKNRSSLTIDAASIENFLNGRND